MLPDKSLLNQAKMLNGEENYHDTLQVLDRISAEYSDDPYCCLRRGIALYQLHREDESVT